jgi:ABC-type transport system involved in Fe-S cluster assembly fused permease/ATPase subunit
MSGGKIVETGTHLDLMSTQGAYFTMFQLSQADLA